MKYNIFLFKKMNTTRWYVACKGLINIRIKFIHDYMVCMDEKINIDMFVLFLCVIFKTHSTLLNQTKNYMIVFLYHRSITTACQICPSTSINEDSKQITHMWAHTCVYTRCPIIPLSTLWYVWSWKKPMI